MSICPKNKSSKARRDKRRANWKMTAPNLVKCSKEGNYNKTYKALRSIQKYEFRLEKEQLVKFYSDIHAAVAESCEKYGIDESGKKEMWVIVDALFSDKLKEEVNN